jgi:hypothetical protein
MNRGAVTIAAIVSVSAGAWAGWGVAYAQSDSNSHTYVGTKKCKKCHLDVHKSWAKTRMGMAFATLEPGAAAEAKTKSGLDPKKDYTTDTTCLKCHTTGYGKEGGYHVPDPANKREARKMKDLQGIGCESCHGPGSEYVKIFEEIDKSQRNYTQEELHSAGLKKTEKSQCVVCHNDEGPTFNPDEPFDYDTVMKEDKAKGGQIHEHTPLKLRAE